MSNIKQKIKKIFGYKNFNYMRFIRNVYRSEKKSSSKSSIIKILTKTKTIQDYRKLFDSIDLKKEYKNFYYSLDNLKTYTYKGRIISNLMIDYNNIINKSLNNLRDELEDSDFSNKVKECINAIELLIDRELEIVKENKEISENLNGIKYRKANSFRDALQRILFYNQLMWQTGHNLNGLGRLDLILSKYYYEDLQKNIITKESAKELLKEFLKILHKDYYFKSSALYGDTGQIIILGGLDNSGKNFVNELTYIFIELIKELQIPDPKLLLRVNKDTPRDLVKISLECIQTGIGCPLFANDDIIIPKLIEFGFDKEDAINYGTSACWEPFIIGKSFDQNNLESISFMEPLKNIINSKSFFSINSKEKLIKEYKRELIIYLDKFLKEINNEIFGEDILLSLFTEDCINNKKDISQGGAKYNNYGFTGVGLSNVINSMLMINKYVFEDKRYTLQEFNNIRKNNFVKNEELLKELKRNKYRYGVDYNKIIELSNDIIKTTSRYFEGKINPLGGKYKFGLSAPSYIDASKNFSASFDGRKKGDPFGVNISSDTPNAYTEIVNFASKLDYSINAINGNVVDFFVSPSFIEENLEKFLNFLVLSIKVGFFEMQMNVVSSKTLIKAKKNPEEFPNLIVRVWGFSAYFNELPDKYKDYLIERALKSESNNY